MLRRKKHPLKIGVIAPEFPPQHGGMQEHAYGVVRHFSRRHDILLFTASGNGISLPNVRVIDELTGSTPGDVSILKRYRTDAWLAMSAGTASYAPYLLPPFFSYVHGNDFVNPWTPSFPRWLRRLNVISSRASAYVGVLWRRRQIGMGLHRAALIFANSQYTRRRCHHMFSLNPDRLVVVAPGIDDAYFAAPLPPARVKNTGPLKILTVSRLSRYSRRKNVEAVVTAIAAIGDCLDVQCTIIGDGDDKVRLEHLAADLGVSSRIYFAGGIRREQMSKFFVSADVFALPVKPSRSDVEGFGMVYVEAAAHGLPVIAVDCGGIGNSVSPATGILLKNSSASEVAEALRHFHSNRSKFQPQAIRGAVAHFAAEETSKQLMYYIERTFVS